MSGTSRLARIARITAKIGLWIIAACLLLVVILVAVNSIDVPLNASAKALLIAPPNPYPADQNIYLAMAGLDHPGDRPIAEMGQERIALYDQSLDTTLLYGEVPTALELEWSSASIKFSGELSLGSPRSASIWNEAKSRLPEIAAALAANHQLYQRYLSLHQLKGYYETARPSFMAPVIVLPAHLRALFLGDVANRIQTGTPAERRDALNDLSRDMQMWHRVLMGDGNLIYKMLPIAYLHADLLLLGDLVTDPSMDLRTLDDLLDPMLVPWDLKDYRIGNTFAAEYRARSTLYGMITAKNELIGSPAHGPSKIWNAFQAHFFKPHDTENIDAELTTRAIAVTESEPSELLRNRQALEDWLEKESSHLSPAYIYNPTGKTLARLATGLKVDYALRAYDVAAFQRLVYLVFQLKRQHIATADVAAFMQAHADWSTHPVDGKPFRWSPDSREIAVSTLGSDPTGKRFSVLLPRL